MIGGTTPTFQIMRGVVTGRGLHSHIHGGITILKKIFEKKFGEYKNYILPLAGWVGMSI
jgi:hypothetical protein